MKRLFKPVIPLILIAVMLVVSYGCSEDLPKPNPPPDQPPPIQELHDPDQ